MFNRIYLSPPHMTGKELEYVKDAFKSNWIAPLGPHVDGFEREMCDYLGCKSALALSSGTAAVHLALKLVGIQPGDQVFCSSLTFAASANPIIYAGAEPVFIDSEPESWNMCPKALKLAFEDAEKKGQLPKAVVVVDLYGQTADYDPILEICDHYGVPVIEDAAEALGATYKGRKCGILGQFGILSFNGNKIITTSGGGMLVSDDEEALAKARFLATQARDQAPHYQHSQIGFNYRMSNILAAIGRAQLEAIEDRVTRRREIFETYRKELEGLSGVSFMPEPDYARHNRWLTVMTLDSDKTSVTPADVMAELNRNNVESRPVWKPMHLQPVFEKYAFFTANSEQPFSDKAFERGICLPSGSSLEESELTWVIKIIREILRAGS